MIEEVIKDWLDEEHRKKDPILMFAHEEWRKKHARNIVLHLNAIGYEIIRKEELERLRSVDREEQMPEGPSYNK